MRLLILAYIESDKNLLSVTKFLRKNYQFSEENIQLILKKFQKSVIPKFKKRWQKANRTVKVFLERNEDWLNTEFFVTLPATGKSLNSLQKRGRPCSSYQTSSKSTKKRKNTSLCKDNGLDHLHDAYTQGLRSIGEVDEAKIIELLRSFSKAKKKEVLKTLEESEITQAFDELEALSVYIDLNLTKAEYMYLRNLFLERKLPVFPPYYKIQKAKRSCYPPPASIEITNTYAKVKSLQDLLDHTTARIVMIESVEIKNLQRLTLYCKWGCDGSSGQSEYKQPFPEESNIISDANLFITSLVPIKLVDEDTGYTVWQNPAPSSVRFCRPISIELCKETPAKTKEVVENIETQIKLLSPSIIVKNEQQVEVKHELFLTMIDGKIAQVLTNTPSCSTCTICKATPTQMNDLKRVAARPVNENAFKYGLSTLHAWIRCMEMILHISYNYQFQKWSATKEDHQRIKKEKKQSVQKRFREELGLNIDKPRHASGNSNDGNTARRFFSNFKLTAEITGVDETLIERFYVILQALSSGLPIDPKQFGDYALETAKLYVKKYNWYYMPSSVHKILIHGESIINHFAVLPIGQLSEDAQESRNKDYKRYRLHHSRKCSRSATNEDVFNRLLYTSDPYVTSIRKPPVKLIKDFHEDTLKLLMFPHFISDSEEGN